MHRTYAKIERRTQQGSASDAFAFYQPDPLEIAVGTTVVWTNQDVAPHTVTHGTYVNRGGVFDSHTLEQGQSFTFTFDRAGSYPYTCLIHPEMVGIVAVVGP